MSNPCAENFKKARAGYIEILDSVLRFQVAIDGKEDRELQSAIQHVKTQVESLPFEPECLVELPPLQAPDWIASSETVNYSDTRIERIIDGAFPPGHRFHDLNKRRMFYHLGYLERGFRQLRDDLREGDRR